MARLNGNRFETITSRLPRRSGRFTFVCASDSLTKNPSCLSRTAIERGKNRLAAWSESYFECAFCRSFRVCAPGAPPLAALACDHHIGNREEKQTQALSLTSVALQIRLSHRHGKKMTRQSGRLAM